jgi:hypothetical protein
VDDEAGVVDVDAARLRQRPQGFPDASLVAGLDHQADGEEGHR